MVASSPGASPSPALVSLLTGTIVVLSRRLELFVMAPTVRTSVVPAASRRAAVGGGMEAVMLACSECGGPILLAEVEMAAII